MASGELFREDLTAFQTCGSRRGAGQTKSSCGKCFGDACYERRLGADDRQAGSNRIGETGEAAWIIDVCGQASRDFGDAGVTRRAIEFCSVWAVCELPGDGVFTAPRTDDKDSHLLLG